MRAVAEQAYENHKNGISEWLEIDEEYYTHLLECLPPIFMDKSSFLNSEPYYHTSDTWEEVFICCKEEEEKYWVKLATKQEYIIEFRKMKLVSSFFDVQKENIEAALKEAEIEFLAKAREGYGFDLYVEERSHSVAIKLCMSVENHQFNTNL